MKISHLIILFVTFLTTLAAMAASVTPDIVCGRWRQESRSCAQTKRSDTTPETQPTELTFTKGSYSFRMTVSKDCVMKKQGSFSPILTAETGAVKYKQCLMRASYSETKPGACPATVKKHVDMLHKALDNNPDSFCGTEPIFAKDVDGKPALLTQEQIEHDGLYCPKGDTLTYVLRRLL